MAKYPKVNYIGNKEKLSDWILSEMPVKEGTVLDLFAGGCSVSYALKAGGYRVISNDILYADYVIARALVENQDQRLEEDIFARQVSNARVAELAERFAFLGSGGDLRDTGWGPAVSFSGTAAAGHDPQAALLPDERALEPDPEAPG